MRDYRRSKEIKEQRVNQESVKQQEIKQIIKRININAVSLHSNLPERPALPSDCSVVPTYIPHRDNLSI